MCAHEQSRTPACITRARLHKNKGIRNWHAIGKRKVNLKSYEPMFRNYIVIAWRNLIKNKGYSAINIGGLALGIAVVILIGLWVIDEFTFDKYHKNYSRIAQIYGRSINSDNGDMEAGPAMMYITGTVLKEHYADHFKHILRANWIQDYTLQIESDIYTRTGEFIESGALEMFSLDMILGDKNSLNEPNDVVLSRSTATAIFGTENPIGKTIRIDNQWEAVVRGVYQDLPKNTRFENVKFFANWDLYETNNEFINPDIWDDYSYNLYVELKSESDFLSTDEALNQFFVDYAPDDFRDLVQEFKPQLFMYAMEKWHLYADFDQGIPSRGRITFVWLFIGIGIFVLLLACINFMNLNTARSEKRAREVGIRKAIGSRRNQLVQQFLSESMLVSVSALLFALLLVLIFLPWFNDLADKNMVIPQGNLLFWMAILLIAVVAGILAGSYPALYLSSFSPIKVLKGTFKVGPSGTVPRKVLVVFQFVVSIILTIGTLVVFNQIQYTKNRPLGYDSNNLLMVGMGNPDYYGKYNLLRNELKNTGFVEEMAQSSSPLTGVFSNGGGFNWPGKDPDRDTSFGIIRVTHDYGNAIGWQFVDGRDFSRDLASDSLAIVINETAVKYMGLLNPVGTYLKEEGDPPLKIIGVVKDMVMQSPYQPVKQTIFFMNYRQLNFVSIKIRKDVSTSEALSKIEQVFAQVIPTASFDYKFVDQEYGNKFDSEERIGNLAGVFTILAIFISFLGLFGLASFVAEKRTKEIGIRKVLGASVYNLWQMLSVDFILLVGISCLIAIPFSYHFMLQWLQKFQYRMDMSWWVFGVAVIGALAITLLTVSYQAIKAA